MDPEKNPADDHIHITLDGYTRSIILTQALCQTILINQNQIIATLEKRDFMEVTEESMKLLDKNFNALMENLPKTVF